MKQTITSATIDKARRDAKPGQPRYEIRDAKSSGLILRVGPTGATWQFRYGLNFKDCRLLLGDIDTWSVAEARDIVARGQAMLRDRIGVPDAAWLERLKVKTGKAEAALLAPAPVRPSMALKWSFADGRAAYLAEIKRTRSNGTYRDYKQKLELKDLQPLERDPLPVITRQRLAGIVGAIHRSGREATAEGVARVLSAMWSWLAADAQLDRSGVAGNMIGLRAPDRTRRPSKRLVADPTLEDLGRIIAIARSGAVDPLIGCAVELVVWSVQRRRAVAGAKLEDFRPLDWGEEGLWYVYADDRKRNDGEAHVVPLPASAWSCVQRAAEIVEADWQRRRADDPQASKPDYLFPQSRVRRRGMELTHLHESTITHTLGFMPGVISSPHDVRRIFGTYGERILGFSRPTTKLILDHSEGGTRSDVTGRHYSLHDGTHEKWPVMRRWTDAVEAEIAGAVARLESIETLKVAVTAARRGSGRLLRAAE
ncbi:MAG: hypothetical protein Devi2KO_28460 [Devosia indica]